MRKENIYIDLSKCSEDERKYIFSLLPEPRLNQKHSSKIYKYLHFDDFWLYESCFSILNKTELTYPDFIKLFEGGEEENEIENIKDIAHTEGVLIGLKICKELWAQGTISHETIQEEIYHYQEELDNLNSNQ